MIFQLAVFSLLLLFLLLVGQFIAPLGGAGSGSRRAAPRTMTKRAESLNAVSRDAVCVYALFAPWALLMYLQGKPDLLPQYLAWLVIAIEVVKGGLIFSSRAEYVRFLGVVNTAVLIFLWLQQLPLFQASPA